MTHAASICAREPGTSAAPFGFLFPLGVGVVLLASIPSVAGVKWLPPCVFHELTGLHCPGCGSTRALHAIAHGDLLRALGCNIMLVAIVALLPAWPLLRHKLRPVTQMRLAWGAAAFVIVFFVIRNLPGLAILAPPQ